MPPRVHCRLRTHRKRWGLTQPELAFLLGYQDVAQLSRIERDLSPPRPEVALACELLFELPPREMFPRLHTVIEEELMRRAYELHQRLLGKDSRTSARKRELLEECLKRAVKKNKDTNI